MTKNKAIALEIYDSITKLFPDAACELNYQADHELLIAIMLSAQATDESVNKVTPELFKNYPTLNDYAKAKVTDLEKAIKSIGLYRNKAKNLQNMAIMVIEKFSGKIPDNQVDLESLPGVGRKTANVFLAEAHHIPKIAVDTHVSRVSQRLGFAKEGASPKTVENNLMKLYPKKLWISLHHKLIFFGRYFCTARKPNCKNCPIIKYCKKPQL